MITVADLADLAGLARLHTPLLAGTAPWVDAWLVREDYDPETLPVFNKSNNLTLVIDNNPSPIAAISPSASASALSSPWSDTRQPAA